MCPTANCISAFAVGFLAFAVLCRTPEPVTAQSDAVAPSAQATSLDVAEKQRVISGAIANLKQHYFDRDVAQTTADALLAHEKSGDDDAAATGEAFASLLTGQMRTAGHDMHLVVEYSQRPLPLGPPVQTAESLARFRNAMLQQNCMIRKVEILPHDIGYLKLDFFPNTSVCGSALKTAMTSLSRANALIFDLRDNTGGFPDSVSLIASYLFDHPEYMFGPRGAPTVDSWTRSPVAGNELADKTVYVLTSASTWSGAEQFSYDLKMLKRATLVGETTRGGAHAGVFHRIDDHFGIGIPEEKPINPFGKDDWEGVGVEPDVKVKAADALEKAVKLIETRVEKKQFRY
ncbi:MAG: S41 family peptidase [Terracidiphilus sp.]